LSELRIAVVGVGNILMGDEGIGVRVVQALEKSSAKETKRGVEFFDAGTALHALLPQLEGYDRMIVVDTVQGGEAPGTIYRFTLEDLEKRRGGKADGLMMSIHEMDVEDTLSMARLTQKLPPEIIFIGVEPEKVELKEELSSTLEKRMGEYIRTVEQEIDRR
jgi:hydrogenase maturation protease